MSFCEKSVVRGREFLRLPLASSVYLHWRVVFCHEVGFTIYLSLDLEAQRLIVNEIKKHRHGDFNFEFYPCTPKLKSWPGIQGPGRETLDTPISQRCPTRPKSIRLRSKNHCKHPSDKIRITFWGSLSQNTHFGHGSHPRGGGA